EASATRRPSVSRRVDRAVPSLAARCWSDQQRASFRRRETAEREMAKRARNDAENVQLASDRTEEPFLSSPAAATASGAGSSNARHWRRDAGAPSAHRGRSRSHLFGPQNRAGSRAAKARRGRAGSPRAQRATPSTAARAERRRRLEHPSQASRATA